MAVRVSDFRFIHGYGWVQEGGEAWRALQLLLDNCTVEQQQSLFDHGYLTVTSNRGERYRLHPTYAYGVERVGKRGKSLYYCAFPGGGLHLFDNMCAQKLLISSDVDAFLRVANRADVPIRIRRDQVLRFILGLGEVVAILGGILVFIILALAMMGKG